MRTQLKVYVAAVLTAALMFVLILDWTVLATFQSKDLVGLGVFVLLASMTQYMAVNSGADRRVRSSVSFLPLLALIVVFPIPAVVLGVVLVTAVTELPGDHWGVTAFNFSETILAYGLAAYIFAALRGIPPGVELGSDLETFLSIFIPFYLAAAAFFALNVLFVSAYLAIRDGQSLKAITADAAGPGGGNFFYDLLASPIAVLAAYLYWHFHVAGLLVVVFPLLLVRYSYLSALQLQRANRDLLRVLIKAIETRDPYTSGHSLRVSQLARLIGEDNKLSGRQLDEIERAALLHDIGKIDALYTEIIAKDAPLTEEERAVIQTHATKGADLLQSLTSLEKGVIIGVRHHHEHFDGSGYPEGLTGKSIPLAARIIMICDSVDAMLSDRPYRAALPVKDVRAELVRCAGSQFDPDLVRTILEQNTLERAELLVDRSGARAPVRVVGQSDNRTGKQQRGVSWPLSR